MYIKPKTEKSAKLAAKEFSFLCDRQKEIFRFVSQKEVLKQINDLDFSHLTPLLVKYIFKQRIGVMPNDFEEVTNEQQLYYSALRTSQMVNECDDQYVNLMSGTMFRTRQPESPKKNKFLSTHIDNNHNFKTLNRIDSEFLDT